MYCRNCGNELDPNEKYCKECGVKVSGSRILMNRKKRNIIIAVTVICSVLLLSVCSYIIIQKINTPTDILNDAQDNKLSDNLLKKAATPLEWVINHYYSDYKMASSGDTIILKYKYVDGIKYYDCSEYQDSILATFIEDCNNDNLEDVTIISLDINEDGYIRDDGYGAIYVYIKTYLSTDHYTYELFDSLSDKLMFWIKEDHVEENVYYSIETDDNGNKDLIIYNQQNNDSELYDDSARYYSVEDSLGKFSDSFAVYSLANTGYQFQFRTSRFISHISCMPEAEDIRYEIKEDKEKERTLYVDGKTVTTGSDMLLPLVRSFKQGECDNDDEACDVINNLISQYNLTKYEVEPIDWESRFDHLLIPKSPQKCAIHTTIVTKDEESGDLQIKIME